MGWFGGKSQCYHDGCIGKGLRPWIFNLTIKGNVGNLKIVSVPVLSINPVTIKGTFKLLI